MNKIQLQMKTNIGTTSVSNLFIDSYMPSANGSYVKVYLTLLRCMSEHRSCSLSDLADQLEDSEKDILRALKYWKKMNLIELLTNEQNQLTQITFLNPVEKETTCTLEVAADKTVSETRTEETVTLSSPTNENTNSVPVRKIYTSQQVDELRNENEINHIFKIVEIYRQGRLQTKDIQLIPYLYVDLGFSSDLITYLYEYCLSIQKDSPAYIEKVALSWAKDDIKTVAQAERTISSYHENYKVVMKAFGLNRTPAAIEKQYIDDWYRYGFTAEIIELACNRTVLNTHQPDFKYTNSILNGWHKQGAYTMSDIEALDKQFKGRRKETEPAKNAKNKFQNFPQRDYSHDDYSSLEQQLLGK